MLAALQSFGVDNINGSGSPVAFTVIAVAYVVVLAIGIVAMWKVYEKAGKPGWASIVPFYSTYVLSEISGRPGSFGLIAAFISLVPFLGWIAAIVMYLMIVMGVAEKFGKSQVFGVVALWLFAFIGYLILGFGDAKYDPTLGRQPETLDTPPPSPSSSAPLV